MLTIGGMAVVPVVAGVVPVVAEVVPVVAGVVPVGAGVGGTVVPVGAGACCSVCSMIIDRVIRMVKFRLTVISNYYFSLRFKNGLKS